MRLSHIAEQIGGQLFGDPDIEITGVAGIREAGDSDLTFLANARYENFMESTRAAAVVVGLNGRDYGRPHIRVGNPYLGYVQAIRLLHGSGAPAVRPGIHPRAIVSGTAQVGEGVHVGAGSVIEDDARIGDRTVILPQAHVGCGSRLGEDCLLYPGAVVREKCTLGDRVILHCGAVVGSDGFGYVWDGERHQKIPHLGIVVLEDDVEIGANAAIDRGTTGETRVGAGTKIDNLVQVAHNVRIGEHSLLCAQAGVSGSSELGRRVTLAGQVGLAGHLKIGDGAIVGAQSGVERDVPENEFWFGYPAKDRHRAMREYASLGKLPELLRRVRQLEERLEQLDAGEEP